MVWSKEGSFFQENLCIAYYENFNETKYTYKEHRKRWTKTFQFLLGKSKKPGSKITNHTSNSAKIVKLPNFW